MPPKGMRGSEAVMALMKTWPTSRPLANSCCSASSLVHPLAPRPKGLSLATSIASAAVSNLVVYVGSNDGNVYAIGNEAAATGQGTTPGFDVVLAFVGLVIAAYAVKRKR